ncbi:hypothetical protein [Hymenobacter persicinus]|uniref:Uncharacterized protein n=1 Tax=Hymenobacter persicinus TaxID=2025506 RepID=A0A4V1ZAR7_9BACT|nr:hypothetical protein [Hymenobacter persicinus]RYU79554.1 hypothetical protein EWM57_10330 [Hymenobacter persicinus]
MKHSLLLFLLLPLHAFAQYRPTYTGPTMQQNQQSRQDFNRMVNQRTQDFQMRQMQRYRSGQGSPQLLREMQQQAQAHQLELEKNANEKLAQLAQQQQLKRQEHPAANPQQAAAQQKEDSRQLTLLAVRNYREVFLPGQMTTVLQAEKLAPEGQQQLHNLNAKLADKSWWKKQDAAQLASALTAYSDTLTSLTTSLLGFNLASPPAVPAPFSVSALETQLATHVFDQKAATQLLQDAALTEKLVAGDQLIKAVNDFSSLSAAAAAGGELQRNPKKVQEDVLASLHVVGKGMDRYNARVRAQNNVFDAEKALLKSTSAYVAKNRK